MLDFAADNTDSSGLNSEYNFQNCKFRSKNEIEYFLPACCPGRKPTEKAAGFRCEKLSINSVSVKICEICQFFQKIESI